MASYNTYRRLTLFLSCTVLLANIAALHGYRYLPDDPLHLAWHLSIYSYFASVLAALGFIGARKNNATLVSIFSNYLIIDTFISVLPRLVAIGLCSTVRGSICSVETIHAWIETETQSAAIASDEITRQQMMGQCRKVVGILQILMILFAIAITITQITLAFRVSAYARMLRQQEDQEMLERVDMAEQESNKRIDEKSHATSPV